MSPNTLNFELLSTSPAINKGISSPGLLNDLDLKGQPRIYDENVDIGAFEFQSTATKSDNFKSEQITIKPIVEPLPISNTESRKESSIDWSKVKVLSKGSTYASSLKMIQKDLNMFVKVDGKSLDQKGQFYLNTDNNELSGFQVHFWKASGAEYLLENGRLYQYTGLGGSDWSWKFVALYKGSSRYSQSTSSIEVSFSPKDLGITSLSPIKIGFVWNDSKVDSIPMNK